MWYAVLEAPVAAWLGCEYVVPVRQQPGDKQSRGKVQCAEYKKFREG
jgi:hypothetical protein